MTGRFVAGLALIVASAFCSALGTGLWIAYAVAASGMFLVVLAMHEAAGR